MVTIAQTLSCLLGTLPRCLEITRIGKNCIGKPYWNSISRRSLLHATQSQDGYETWKTAAIIIQKGTELKMPCSP